MTKPKVLLLANIPRGIEGTIVSNLYSIACTSIFSVDILNPLTEKAPDQEFFNIYDIVFIHYSIYICIDSYLSPEYRYKIRMCPAKKIAYIQDDYRKINSQLVALRYLSVDVIFTLADENLSPVLYHRLVNYKPRCVQVLTGYYIPLPDDSCLIDYSRRPIDVFYRARKLTAEYGRHAIQKWQIAEEFLNRCESDENIFNLDISTDGKDRLYGEAYEDRLKNSKAVLGTESGASVIDFDGMIEQKVREHEERFPGDTFDNIESICFPEQDHKYLYNVVSPRIFESIAYENLLVLFSGTYQGLLRSNVDYVELKKDFTNFKEVLGIVRDPIKAQVYIDNAKEAIESRPELSYVGLLNTFEREAMNLLQITGHTLTKKSSLKEKSLDEMYSVIDGMTYTNGHCSNAFREDEKLLAGDEKLFIGVEKVLEGQTVKNLLFKTAYVVGRSILVSLYNRKATRRLAYKFYRYAVSVRRV